MDRTKLYFIGGILFTAILGTLSHFFYDWTGQGALIGLVSPVNESTWEHMKLLFFPMLLYGLVAVPKLKSAYPFLPCAYGVGILLGLLLIPTLFYTYSGILGFSVPPVDITIFYISVIADFLLCARKAKRAQKKQLTCPKWEERLLILSLLLFFAGFVFFTATPPDLGIFQSTA